MPATADLLDGRKSLTTAIPGYVQAEEFYDGEVGETFASPKVRQLLAKAGTEVINDFNYAHIPVDTITDKLKIHAVTAITGEQDGTPDEQDELVQQALDHILKRNQMDLVFTDLHKAASKLGDSYLLIWPVLVDEDEPDDNEDDEEPATVDDAITDGDLTPDLSGVEDVDIRLCSPLTTRAIYDPEDTRVIRYVVRMWEIPDPENPKRRLVRVNLFYRDRVERWVTIPGKKGDNPRDWEPYTADGRPETLPNPTGRIPFFHYRNEAPYGRPEHRNAYGPQQVLNKLVGAHGGTIDFQTFPQRYALVDPKADQVLGNLVDPDYPEDEDDDPESEQNASVLKADPSAVWKLFGVTQTGQYAVADPDVFLKPYDRYVRAMSEVTGIPLYRFGSGLGQVPSGAALDIANEPLNNMVLDRRMRYEATHKDALEFALFLLGFDSATVLIAWAPLKAARDGDAWQVVGLKIQNGVPPRHALVEAGYMPDEVDKWLNEPGNIDMIRRVALLTSFADAAQKLGAAAGLRVVSLDAAAKLIAAMLAPVVDGTDAEELEDEEQFAPDDIKMPDVDTPVTPPPVPPGQPGAQPPAGTARPNGRQPQPAGASR